MAKYYLVWHPNTSKVLLEADRETKLNILVSYFFATRMTGEYYTIPGKFKNKVFLDSGAYSAFVSGRHIDIEEYMKWVDANKAHTEVYANLDVIGNAEKTLQNQKFMEEAGYHPLPCFHAHEDWHYLEDYCKDHDYIALGGVAQLKGNKRLLISWLKRCFQIIPKEVKVHGFAITSSFLVNSFPFYSIDSSSWSSAGRWGQLTTTKGSELIRHAKGKFKNSSQSNYLLHKFNAIQWSKLGGETI